MKRFTATIILTLALVTSGRTDTLPGYDRFDIKAAHRARLVAATIWYPALGQGYRIHVGDGPIFKPVPALMAPAMSPGYHPLILLSHGSGGNADNLGWLAAALVVKGAIVLAVNHPGSTSGDSSARRSLDLGARATDLSAALDTVLANPDFAPYIDQARIGVIGFSLGGATALELAGIRFDSTIQAARCKTGPDAADCGFFLRGGADFTHAPGFSAGVLDPRFSRVVAIDPAFGGAATPASIAGIAIPVHLINLGEKKRIQAVNVGPGGNDLARRIPGATYSVIAPADHFSFLAACKPEAGPLLREEGEDPICEDIPGVSRTEIHQRLIDNIATSFELPGTSP